jgi:hypothetical protein
MVSHIRDSDAKVGSGQGQVQGRVNATEVRGEGAAAAVLRSGAENLDNQKIRGSGPDHHDSDGSGAATYHRSRV